MFYAYDKATGAVVHQLTLPGGTCGNPMTYAINGKQYIAVSVGSRTTRQKSSRWRCLNFAHSAEGREQRAWTSSALCPHISAL